MNQNLIRVRKQKKNISVRSLTYNQLFVDIPFHKSIILNKAIVYISQIFQGTFTNFENIIS
jgi:hypothetical protein